MTRRYDVYHSLYFNDRRCGRDRRQFSYATHIPELRDGLDRRSGKERRSFLERREIDRQMLNQTERRSAGLMEKGQEDRKAEILE